MTGLPLSMVLYHASSSTQGRPPRTTSAAVRGRATPGRSSQYAIGTAQTTPVKYRASTAHPMSRPAASGTHVGRRSTRAARHAAPSSSAPQNVCEKYEAPLNRKKGETATSAAADTPTRGL